MWWCCGEVVGFIPIGATFWPGKYFKEWIHRENRDIVLSEFSVGLLISSFNVFCKQEPTQQAQVVVELTVACSGHGKTYKTDSPCLNQLLAKYGRLAGTSEANIR